MTTSPSSSADDARRALGRRLRDLRTGAGLTIRQLAADVSGGGHFSRISKIENGRQLPTPRDIADWCALTGAADQEPDLLAALRAVDSAYTEHRRESRAGMKRVLGAHTPQRYRATSVFRIYEHNVIPGLFQTPEYARAMLQFWIRFLNSPNDIDEAIAVRVERQQIVQRGGRRFVVVLEEQAIRTWFGSAEVQAGQLGRLLEVMALPQVSLGIIPLMRERGGVGSAGFWIFDDDLVALETPSASIQVTAPSEINLYARMFEELKSAALYGQAARQLIVNTLDELSR